MESSCTKYYLFTFLIGLLAMSQGVAQVDTLHINTWGDYEKKELYCLYYNKKRVLEFGDQKEYANTKIIVNTTDSVEVIDLSLYQINGKRLKKIKYYFVYDQNNPYLQIYHFHDKEKMKKLKGYFQVLYRPNARPILYYD